MHSPQVHKLCQEAADKILNEFQPNLMIAIGGGGYVPARILRYALTVCLNLTAHEPDMLAPDLSSRSLVAPTFPSKLSVSPSTSSLAQAPTRKSKPPAQK